MARYSTIIFDLDGTLVDSAPDLAAACNTMLARLDLPPIALETATGFVGNGVETLVRSVLAHCEAATQGPTFDTALSAFLDSYSADLTTRTRPYPGVMAMLDQLAAADLKLAVCTNKPEAPAKEICAAFDLARFFPVIVGGDTLAVKKPDPAPLRHTISVLKADLASTLYVGDTEVDYVTAKAAGVAFAFFEGGYQRHRIADFAPLYRLTQMADVTRIVSQT